jgi:putative transposase
VEVLSWRLSIAMDVSFCIEALEDALSKNEKTEIFNSEAFTWRLKQEGITISMDGRGRWRDNVFVERIWKSIKYEELYLHANASVSQARQSIGEYIDF